MRAAILDCGVGNLHSLARGLEAAGFEVTVEHDATAAASAGCLVLPGVGAFDAAATRIAPARAVLRDRLAAGLPCLAICLGMQLLFESSEEGTCAGLGFMPGTVTRLASRRVPHMGWNELETDDPLFRESGLRSAWFAHGYACRPRDPAAVVAWSGHDGDRFPAAIRMGTTLGVQFHPEKSSHAGIALLRAFRRTVA